MAAALSVSKAALLEAQSQYQKALTNLGKPGNNNANLRQALANVRQAKLNLEYTDVLAPANGKITHCSLRKGDMVHQGETIFSIIEEKDFWVEANFKETQLKRINIGQKATVVLDMFPNHPLEGYVSSISGGTGASFSILPPENATGNWVKVTQRIPVKIRLENIDRRLALGASATVTIDTHGHG